MSACARELSKQKELSPCVVDDDEDVVYVLINPDYWDGLDLKAAAFSKTKLRGHDLSICRARYTSVERARSKIVEPYIESIQTRKEAGGLRAVCADLRQVRHDDVPDKRLVCVLDDGLEGFEGHAVIGFACAVGDSSFWTRSRQVAVRQDIVKQFSKNGIPLPLDQCLASEVSAG